MKKSAFSLIEISVVILIIGILVAGVTQSSRLVSQMRLASARAMTQSSPVHSIGNLVIWLETTSEASFDDATEDGTQINSPYVWRDINGQISQKSNASSPSGPIYIASCIESLPCLRFNGSSQYLTIAQKNGVAEQISVFAVIKIAALSSSPTTIFSSIAAFTSATNYFYDYLSAGNQVGFSTYSAGLSGGPAFSVNKATLHEIIDNGTSIKLATSSGGVTVTRLSQSVATGSKNLDSGLTIGAYFNGTIRNMYFNGDIGEIIVFDRALKNQERDDVERYLSKKWGFKI